MFIDKTTGGTTHMAASFSADAVMRRTPALLAALLLVASLALLVASPARAGFGISTFDANVFDGAGLEETGAGVHPATAVIDYNLNVTAPDENGLIQPDEDLKDLIVDLPVGFVGDPTSLATCGRHELLLAACPYSSMVGTVRIQAALYGFDIPLTIAVYNLTRSAGEVARFGFTISSVPVYLSMTVRKDGSYGVRSTTRNISQLLGVHSAKVTLWGVPADPSHDFERCNSLDDSVDPAACTNFTGNDQSQPHPASGVRAPLFSNPTYCGPANVTTLRVRSWQHPDDWHEATSTTSTGPTRCDRLRFEPSLRVTSDTGTGGAGAGVGVEIGVPQDDTATNVATPSLKDAVVTLPEGMTLSPSAADGLQSCSDEQLNAGSEGPMSCPASSKIGTVALDTPLLERSLVGGVYVGAQRSADPASGDMFLVFLAIEDEDYGLSIRLRGAVRADPLTGRLSVTFADNPQLPFSRLRVELKGGARAPLVMPSDCGTHTASAQLTPWAAPDAQPVTVQSSIAVTDCAAAAGFGPSLAAGAANPVGGAFSPFTVTITKPDGQQALTGLSMSLPRGLLAQVKGNVGTQVGTVRAFAGPGSNPYMLPGQVFLEGPYGDAPFSLRVVVPAKAGPFDLGEVVVRQKISIDPIDAHVTIVSDPLPTIVSGVPVRLRRIDVDVDKAGFMVNPTSCAAKEISATLRSAAGAAVPITNRFQVTDCGALALKPALALTLSGKGQTVDGKHPAISAVLTQPAGQANLKKVRVALPLSLALDPDNAESGGLCSFIEGSKADPKCPASSVVGRATAITPILNEPLSGPVYFTKNERIDAKSGRSIRTLPKLVVPMVGENGVKLTLTGTSAVVRDQLVTTFDDIPDAAVSSFKLDIAGGAKGILVISGDKVDICKATQIADQQIDGQNNKDADVDVSILTPSCPLKILSKRVGRTSVVVKVGGLSAGKVTLTGRGIKRTTKIINKSTVATITAKRGKGALGRVTVSFDPAGPAKARKISK